MSKTGGRCLTLRRAGHRCCGLGVAEKAFANHGAGAVERHAPRNGRQKTGVEPGLSVQAASKGFAGMSRPRFFRIAQSHLRAWLFLAQAQGLRVGEAAEIEA